MKRMALGLAAILVLSLMVCGASVAQGNANVAGKWEMSSQGRQGPITQEMTIEQTGDKVKITIKGQRGERTGEGTIKGNNLAFTMKFQRPDGGEISQEYKGTVDGDNIKGTVEMSGGGGPGGGPREWTAKKVK